ncbi:MAG: YggT family protein [Candidatus Velthaea sp.]
MLPCNLYTIVGWFLQAYIFAMLLYALVSWVPSLRGRWSEYIAMVVEPVLQPIRRVIPPLGGFDLSFLVLIIVIQFVLGNFVRPYSCGTGIS